MIKITSMVQKLRSLDVNNMRRFLGTPIAPSRTAEFHTFLLQFRVCRQLKWKRRQSSERATQKSSVIYFYSECIKKNDTVNNYTLIINYIGISWILIGFIASVFFPCIFFYHIPFVHISQSQVDSLFLSVRNDAL